MAEANSIVARFILEDVGVRNTELGGHLSHG